jgi:hypothetical protein
MGILAKKTGAADSRLTRELVILNRYGLHARPAALFVKTSNRFKAEVWVEKDGEEVNGSPPPAPMPKNSSKKSRISSPAASTRTEPDQAFPRPPLGAFR